MLAMVSIQRKEPMSATWAALAASDADMDGMAASISDR